MLTRSFLRHTLLASAAALAFCGATAQATQFQTGGYVDNPPIALNVTVVGPPGTTYGGGDGGFSGIWDPAGAHLSINYWCYDLFHVFNPGTTYNYNPTFLNNADISRLFTEVGGSGGALASNITSAAFQIAIWEIEYDDADRTLAGGNFKVALPGGGDQLAAYTLAQTWLTNLNNFDPNFTIVLLSSLENPQSQNFITDVLIPGTQSFTPEPGSLALLGIGMLAAMFTMRRRTSMSGRQ
jgi:hypothetical protein